MSDAYANKREMLHSVQENLNEKVQEIHNNNSFLQENEHSNQIKAEVGIKLNEDSVSGLQSVQDTNKTVNMLVRVRSDIPALETLESIKDVQIAEHDDELANLQIRTVMELIVRSNKDVGPDFRAMKVAVSNYANEPTLKNAIACFNAASTYHNSHRGIHWTPTGRQRMSWAKTIEKEFAEIVKEKERHEQNKEQTEQVFSEKYALAENETADARIAKENLTEKVKAASKRRYVFKEMKNAYTFYANEINQDMYLSPLEKVEKKLQFFEINKATMLLGLYKKSNVEVFQDLLRELETLERSKKVLEKEQQTNESKTLLKSTLKKIKENDLTSADQRTYRKDLNKKIDDGLTQKQMDAINEIDQWVLRNLNNGGVAGKLSGIQAFRENMAALASSLMSMTQRERLNVYYLVETKERKNPSVESLLKAQGNEYVPNLSKFKNQMIMTKFKVFSHLKSGYIYWQKIGEAIRITRNQGDLIEGMFLPKEELLNESKDKVNDGANDGDPLDADAQIEDTKATIINKLNEYNKKLKQYQENPDSFEAQQFKDESEAVFKEIEEENRQLFQKFNFDVDLSIEKQGKAFKGASKVVKTSGKLTKTISSLLGLQKLTEGIKTLKEGLVNLTPEQLDAMKPKLLGAAQEKMANRKPTAAQKAAKGLTIAGGLISIIGGLTTTIQEGNMLSGFDVADVVLDFLLTLGKGAQEVVKNLGKKVTKIATKVTEKLANNATMAEKAGEKLASVGKKIQIAATVTTVAIGAFYVGKGAMEIASASTHAKNLKQVKDSLKERDMENKKDTEAQYLGRVSKLSERLNHSKKMRGVSNIVTGACTFLTLATGGAGAGLFLLAAKISDKLIVRKPDRIEKIMDSLFDDYYKLDSVYQDACAGFAKDRNLDPKLLTDKEKEEIREHTRRRLMVELGYANKDEAVKAIASQYATHIKEVLNKKENDNPDYENFTNLVKSLGLKIDDKKDKPTQANIMRKLMGK